MGFGYRLFMVEYLAPSEILQNLCETRPPRPVKGGFKSIGKGLLNLGI